MIAADTSIWVAALRDRNSAAARALSDHLEHDRILLPAPVRIEILSGAPRRDLVRLRRLLSALPIIYPDEATWRRIDDWLQRAVAAGQRFGFADLLIASLVRDRKASLWSFDSDFSRMQRLGFIELHTP